jgi:hypothetical protein
MRRREFITVLGGAAAAWPLAARTQQAERMRRIGVLDTLAADDPFAQARQGAFLQGLQQSGWTIGRNVQIDTRWSSGSADAMRKHRTDGPEHIPTPSRVLSSPVRYAVLILRGPNEATRFHHATRLRGGLAAGMRFWIRPRPKATDPLDWRYSGEGGAAANRTRRRRSFIGVPPAGYSHATISLV